MSESITTYQSSRTIATPAGTEASMEMDPVSVTQPYFFSNEGQGAQGYETIVVDDGGCVSSDPDPDTLDKISIKRASLYASLAIMALLVIGVVIQEDIGWLYKQPLSTTIMNEAFWAANPNKVEVIKPLPIKFVAVVEEPLFPSLPSVTTPQTRSLKHTVSSRKKSRLVPVQPVQPVQPQTNEDEPIAESPFELSAESADGLDIAPPKHTVLDREANPFVN